VQQLFNSMARIGPMRLAAVGALTLGLIIFFVFLSMRLSSGQMKLLYSDLSAQDRNAVVRELESAGVTYNVNDGSGEILVGAKEVGRVRMLLAEKGLPEGGSIGYEIFDKGSSMGQTRFEQDVKQLRALEGELVRTVSTLKPVESARVHLVLPKRELFSRDTQTATASVFLKLKGGQTLDSEQIAAVQHLVAAAVPELSPKYVSIVDQSGNLLANGREEMGDGLTTGNVEKLRMGYEQRLMSSIEDMVGRIVGVGKVRVQVTADIDYDKITTSAEQYDPEGQVVRSTQTTQENENESQASQNNVSVQNNLPGLPAEGGAGGSGSRENNRTEEVTNFEISKTVKSHVREGGQVRNLSVAVLVDGVYSKDKDDKLQYAERSKEELERIKTLVSSAIGYNEKRGDKLEVINMRFAEGDELFTSEIEDGVFMGMGKDDLFRMAETGILGLVSILVVLLVLRPMAAKLLTPRDESGGGMNYATGMDGMPLLDSQGRPMLAGPAAANATAMIDRPSQAAVEGASPDDMIDVASVDGKLRAASIQKVNEIIDRYPNEAVSVIRSWMFQEQ
jgi:flagellar M-ring protein FliF